MMALQIASIVISIKCNLFELYNLQTRDLFVSNDIITSRYDVEQKLTNFATHNAEILRSDITNINEMVKSGDIDQIV